ncbi:Stk1 family PASTA domain-containing Ser/Thr kinase [Kineococcus radiotolerans]|uniref:non-specific serine/threonine protein kinase n=1 Tax=Kineococcus radiotolerans (strain ATCC BAA-149 / DSM 14245 / SRS30216) TaxID=266940 RepID=A6WD07_KINRD|nr:Stk1 family PASTA domain-containing Ser/Thr kinase [Kineococcus radiotolerans]ABS04696.1 protein kinase [Kineococcus radiotolerans SRS30216 = ATCC BAA-149]
MDATLSDPLVGRRLDGRYRVLGRIGRGGMGVVYRAEDERLERAVALKVLRADLAHDPAARARFVREAKSAARLAHPGVVAVLDQGVDHEGGLETAYLVMELVDGRTLRDVVLDSGALTPGEALSVVGDVLEALAEAHRKGVLHRDVKTANVLVADDGRVKVADFGLARVVSPGGQSTTVGMGDLMGTAEYLAPEQLETGETDTRSDVYGVGVVLHEVLTGTPPFTGESPFAIAYKHVHEPVPPPSTRVPGLPPALDALVLDALAKDPDERPADAGEMLEQLRAVRASLTPEQLGTRPPRPAGTAAPGSTTRLGALAAAAPPPRPVHPGRRSRRGLLAGLVLLVLAVAAGVAWYLTAGPGAYTTTPAVAGKSPQEATAVLRAAGLGVQEEQGFSDTVPQGLVVTSDPGDGERVRKDGTVTLVVSQGVQQFPVPDVVGRTREEAQDLLTGTDLAVGAVTEEFSEDVAEGAVVRTDPAAATVVPHDSPVALVVSKGREPIGVPGLVGRTQDAAQEAITDAGLTVGAVTRQVSETVAAGQVISQDPVDGTLFRGDPVALVVSSGPPLVQVPAVQGKQVDAVRAQLEGLGFRVQVNNVLGGVFGTVRDSDPPAGQSVPKGSTVTLTVV